MNTVSKDQMNSFIDKLEKKGNLLDNSHLGVIEKTSKDIVDLFGATDSVVDFSQKGDLDKLADALDKKEELIKRSEHPNNGKLSDNYIELYDANSLDLSGNNLNTKRKKVENQLNTDIYANDDLLQILEWTDFKAEISGIRQELVNNNIEKYGNKNPSLLSDSGKRSVIDTFVKGKLPSKMNDEIKNKVVSLLLMISQLSYIQEKGKKEEQFDLAEKILKSAIITKNQILAYRAISEALEKVEDRQVSIKALFEDDKNNTLPPETPDKNSSKTISFNLEDYIVNDKTKLSESPDAYEINKFEILDNKGVKVDLYEDVSGKPLSKTIKSGEDTDVFVKDKGGKFVKLGNIAIDSSNPRKVEIKIEAYKNMPTELEFPIKIDMSVAAVAGKAGTLEHKVSISKTISSEFIRPDFSREYDGLDAIIGHNAKLQKLYDNLYETILRDEMCKHFDNHENDSVRNGWKSLPYEKKRTFFMDVIQSNAHPVWGAGISGMHKVWASRVLTPTQFEDAFKDDIVKSFVGKTERELKEYILEKLGTEPWTVQNPTYAQGIMGGKIKETFDTDPAQNILWMAMNKFLLGLGAGSITQASNAQLHPNHPNLHGPKDITASVADAEAISEERALEMANADFAQRYQDSMKWSLTRAKLFFFRSSIINKSVKKTMRRSSGRLLTDAETSSAVNRWMLKKEMDMEGADKIDVETGVFTAPGFQTDLNNLVNDYLSDTTTLDANSFRDGVNRLIENNPDLSVYMKKNKITQIGSNLIDKVEFEKEQRVYYKDLLDIIADYNAGNIKTKADFDNKIRQKLADFSKKQNRLPDLVKEMNLNIDHLDFAEKLANHKDKLETMRLRTVNMRVNMLINAHPKREPEGFFKKFASGVQKDERGLTTAQHVQIDKLGGRSKFYRRIEKHPWWTAFGVTAGLASAALIPVVGVGVGASMLFTLNYFKKRGHYTKEHVKFEKELLSMTPAQRDKYIKDMLDDAKKRPDWLRKIFPKKYDKYADSMQYIEQTQSVQQHIKDIKRYTDEGRVLGNNEQHALREYMLKGIAALHLQETEGRNFMTSEQGKKDIEVLYNDLYNSVIGGFKRLRPNDDPIQAYARVRGSLDRHNQDLLSNSDYDHSQGKMRRMRNKLGLFAGTKSAAIYLGTAWLIGQMREGWDHLFGGVDKGASTTITNLDINSSVQAQIQGDLGRTIDFNNISTADKLDILKWLQNNNYNLDPATGEIFKQIVTSGGLQLDPAFGVNGQDLLQKVFDGDVAKFELFKSKMSSLNPGDRSSTLRGTLKEIYGTNGLATEKTNAFFEHFGANIMENGKHELIALTSNTPLTNAGAEKIAQKMGEWYSSSGILSGSELGTVTDPAKIKSLFDGFANGSHDLNNLPAGWDVNTANAALHSKYAGFGDGLKDYIFDIGSSSTKDIVGKIGQDVLEGGTPWGWGRFNSFGVPTVRNEINEFKEK